MAASIMVNLLETASRVRHETTNALLSATGAVLTRIEPGHLAAFPLVMRRIGHFRTTTKPTRETKGLTGGRRRPPPLAPRAMPSHLLRCLLECERGGGMLELGAWRGEL